MCPYYYLVNFPLDILSDKCIPPNTEICFSHLFLYSVGSFEFIFKTLTLFHQTVSLYVFNEIPSTFKTQKWIIVLVKKGLKFCCRIIEQLPNLSQVFFPPYPSSHLRSAKGLCRVILTQRWKQQCALSTQWMCTVSAAERQWTQNISLPLKFLSSKQFMGALAHLTLQKQETIWPCVWKSNLSIHDCRLILCTCKTHPPSLQVNVVKLWIISSTIQYNPQRPELLGKEVK